MAKESKMNSRDFAKLLLESYPDNDLLPIEPKEVNSLQSLVDKSKDCGDSLFRHIVVEAVEGATTDGDMVDTHRFEELLTRSIEDMRSIIRALPDPKGFYR